MPPLSPEQRRQNFESTREKQAKALRYIMGLEVADLNTRDTLEATPSREEVAEQHECVEGTHFLVYAEIHNGVRERFIAEEHLSGEPTGKQLAINPNHVTDNIAAHMKVNGNGTVGDYTDIDLLAQRNNWTQDN